MKIGTQSTLLLIEGLGGLVAFSSVLEIQYQSSNNNEGEQIRDRVLAFVRYL